MDQMAGGAAKTIGFLLDDQWISEGAPLEVRSPYDHSLVAQTFRPNASHIESAIQAAARAFEITRKLPVYERQKILGAVAQAITAQREDFARTIALEAGKPIKTARAEVERAIFTFSVAAEESTRIYGEWLPLDLQSSTRGRWAIIRRFPVGPIACISPFNFPVNLVAHKWAPALAAGCTVVHKPASQTPLGSLNLARLVQEAGWPAGGLNVLPLSGRDAEILVTDDRLKKLTFTGSPEVGWALKKKAGKKRVTLELGGNAGVIIHSDADLEFAAERCVAGGFSYAGQSCISVQRILVQRSVYDKFLAVFVPRVEKLRVGDPLDESTDVGPMISEDDARRVAEWVDEALAGGAKALCGGKRRGAPHSSLFEPTVLAETRPEMRVNCLEVFAPVVTVQPYDDFGAAVKLVNDSRYGLQAGLFTRDVKLLFSAYEELEVGGVVAGDVPTFRIDHMPYGGVKDSGLGREGLRYAIEEMTERKLLVMNMA
ncbi:MAG TPA: aldehyde dehydrogenase family protein [Terriglobia bacterium]|nr:aldehyde dehydrogenase family protein [Terriglobia bacterium]